MLIWSSQHHLICHMFHSPSFQGPISGQEKKAKDHLNAYQLRGYWWSFLFFSLAMGDPLLSSRNEKESPHLLPNRYKKKSLVLWFPFLGLSWEIKKIHTHHQGQKSVKYMTYISEWRYTSMNNREIMRGSNSQQVGWMARDFF